MRYYRWRGGFSIAWRCRWGSTATDQVTASIGVATNCENCRRIDDLLRRAHLADEL